MKPLGNLPGISYSPREKGAISFRTAVILEDLNKQAREVFH